MQNVWLNWCCLSRHVSLQASYSLARSRVGPCFPASFRVVSFCFASRVAPFYVTTRSLPVPPLEMPAVTAGWMNRFAWRDAQLCDSRDMSHVCEASS